MNKEIPTHFICKACRREWFYEPKKREFYKCECGQVYELVNTRYGWCPVIVGGKSIRGSEDEI